MFETNTDVCTTWRSREALLCCGPRPRGGAAEAPQPPPRRIRHAPEAQPIVKEERYVTFVGHGDSVRRQGVQGLHVHVGMRPRRSLALPRGDRPWPVVLRSRTRCGSPAPLAWPRTAPPSSPSHPGRRAAGVLVWRGGVGRAARGIGVRRLYPHLVGRARTPRWGRRGGIADQPTDARSSAAPIQAMCATALAAAYLADRRVPTTPEPGGSTLRPSRS